MEIPEKQLKALAAELKEREDLRAIRRRLWGGERPGAIGKDFGLSWQKVNTLRFKWSGFSVTELIKYAAVHDMPREELLETLSGIEYVLHGYSSLWDLGYEDDLDWSQLERMVDEGLLLRAEYDTVCAAQVAMTREVLARPRCDPRACDAHDAHLYVVCYGQPVMVKSRDRHAWDDDWYPISHYVGITRQKPAVKRLWQHAAKSAQHVVAVVPGTEQEESALKAFGTCPSCGNSLDYFAENTSRAHFNPLTGHRPPAAVENA